MKKLLLLLIIPFLSFGQEDCLYNEISIIIEGSDTEIGWNIAQDNGWAIVSGALNSVENACIEDGCWTFNMYDGVGDGWLNTSYTIYYSNSGEVVSSGTLDNGNFDSISIQIGESTPCYIYGCTDVTACNYNEEANTDNGTCEFCSCTDSSCPEINIIEPGGECFAFTIYNENDEIVLDFCYANCEPDNETILCGDGWETISLNYCFNPGCYTLELEVADGCSNYGDALWAWSYGYDTTIIEIGGQQIFNEEEQANYVNNTIPFSFNGSSINLGCNLVYVNCDTIYVTDTLYIDNLITDTIIETEYVDVIITEYIDCESGLPCASGMGEIIDKSKTDGKIYNLLGQEIFRRDGIYIEGGEIKYRF